MGARCGVQVGWPASLSTEPSCPKSPDPPSPPTPKLRKPKPSRKRRLRTSACPGDIHHTPADGGLAPPEKTHTQNPPRKLFGETEWKERGALEQSNGGFASVVITRDIGRMSALIFADPCASRFPITPPRKPDRLQWYPRCHPQCLHRCGNHHKCSGQRRHHPHQHHTHRSCPSWHSHTRCPQPKPPSTGPSFWGKEHHGAVVKARWWEPSSEPSRLWGHGPCYSDTLPFEVRKSPPILASPRGNPRTCAGSLPECVAFICNPL
jgi:hypothetical protein